MPVRAIDCGKGLALRPLPFALELELELDIDFELDFYLSRDGVMRKRARPYS